MGNVVGDDREHRDAATNAGHSRGAAGNRGCSAKVAFPVPEEFWVAENHADFGSFVADAIQGFFELARPVGRVAEEDRAVLTRIVGFEEVPALLAGFLGDDHGVVVVLLKNPNNGDFRARVQTQRVALAVSEYLAQSLFGRRAHEAVEC